MHIEANIINQTLNQKKINLFLDNPHTEESTKIRAKTPERNNPPSESKMTPKTQSNVKTLERKKSTDAKRSDDRKSKTAVIKDVDIFR